MDRDLRIFLVCVIGSVVAAGVFKVFSINLLDAFGPLKSSVITLTYLFLGGAIYASFQQKP